MKKKHAKRIIEELDYIEKNTYSINQALVPFSVFAVVIIILLFVILSKL